MNISGVFDDHKYFRIVWLGYKIDDKCYSRHTSVVRDCVTMMDAIREFYARAMREGWHGYHSHIISCKVISHRKTVTTK